MARRADLKKIGREGFEELKKIEQRNLKIEREGFEELKKIEQRIGRIWRLPPYQEPQPRAPGMKEAVIDCNQAADKYDGVLFIRDNRKKNIPLRKAY